MKRLKSHAIRPQLVCLSHLRWDFVYQRPQHLMSRASEHFDVTYVEEPVFEGDGEPHLHWSERGSVKICVPALPERRRAEDVYSATVAKTVAELLGSYLTNRPAGLRVLWYYTPMALAFSQSIDADVVVYDNMDELSAFLGASSVMAKMEDELLERADVVFTGGMSLYAAKRDRHSNVHAFPSCVDIEHFRQARGLTGAVVAEQKNIPTPIVGFFGVIDERLDVRLLDEIATLRANFNFVMVGPVVKINAATLPRRANIHWLGAKGYATLPRYLSGWSAGFMPFALNESTRFISPTKTPEFLAAGLQVVSTPIVDVVNSYGKLGLVEIATGPAEFAAKLDVVMSGRPASWLAKVDEKLAAQSWDNAWGGMLQQVNMLSRGTPAVAATKVDA